MIVTESSPGEKSRNRYDVHLLTLLSIFLFCSSSVLGLYVDPFPIELSVTTGTEATLPISLKSVVGSERIVVNVSSTHPENISFKHCFGSYTYNEYVTERFEIIGIKFVTYYPMDYEITVQINDDFINKTIVHATGYDIQPQNGTICLNNANLSDRNTYKRSQRYGFNTSLNLPLMRLQNKTRPSIKINQSVQINKSIINDTKTVEVPIITESIKNNTNTTEEPRKINYSSIPQPTTPPQQYQLTNILTLIIGTILLTIVCVYTYRKINDDNFR